MYRTGLVTPGAVHTPRASPFSVRGHGSDTYDRGYGREAYDAAVQPVVAAARTTSHLTPRAATTWSEAVPGPPPSDAAELSYSGLTAHLSPRRGAAWGGVVARQRGTTPRTTSSYESYARAGPHYDLGGGGDRTPSQTAQGGPPATATAWAEERPGGRALDLDLYEQVLALTPAQRGPRAASKPAQRAVH
jgi:hypothetical protein